MKKKIVTLSATMLLTLALGACGPKDNPVSSTVPTPPPSSTTPPISSGDPVVVETMPTYYKELNSGARTREFDSNYDVMIDDFSSETLKGSVNGEARQLKTNTLRVSLESSDVDNFPSTSDKSIYKQARKDDVNAYDEIGFRIRLVKGKLKLSDLVLGLRGDDAYNVFEVNVGETLNSDGDENSELTSEYSELRISPAMTLDGNEKYTTGADNQDTGVLVTSKIIGFHLMARGDVHAVIDIEEVYGYKGATKTVFEDFNHVKTNTANDGIWWCDSTGYIMQKSVYGTDGSYEVTTDEDISEFDNVVLSLTAAGKDMSLTPVYTSTVGTAVAFESLKDDENNAVVDPVNGCYGSYVINLENSGINKENLKGFKVSFTNEVSLSKVFMTNMEVPEATKTYPVLDTKNAVVFDDFNRTQNRFDTSYETGSTNAIVTEAGLNWAYTDASMTDYISVKDGAAVIDARNMTTDYVKIDEGSKVSVGNQHYMVVSLKAEEGADLGGLRIGYGTDTLWFNDWMAGQGLPSNSDLNNYHDANGFTWYVIDLKLINQVARDLMVIYYSGTGVVSIDTIFFCNGVDDIDALTPVSFDGETAKLIDTAANDGGFEYAWMSIGHIGGSRYVQIVAEGDGQTDLASFRMESTDAASNPIVFANAGLLKMYVGGALVDASYVMPAEETTLVIDLVESGWTNLEAEMTLCFGSWAKSYMNIKAVNRLLPEDTMVWIDAANAELKELAFPLVGSAPAHAYTYLGYNLGESKIKLSLRGDGQANLESFRLTFAENEDYTAFANSGALKMYVDGQAIDSTYVVPTEGVDIVIDLAESGVTNLFTNMILTLGDWGNPGTITVTAVQLQQNTRTIETIMGAVPPMATPNA